MEINTRPTEKYKAAHHVEKPKSRCAKGLFSRPTGFNRNLGTAEIMARPKIASWYARVNELRDASVRLS